MAERKATNKYYPPDWDPSKGSLNTYQKQHPLRARARKLDEGILVVRFEMPFNVWCTSCERHIGRGVRFNAEKKRAGQYYSTTIWSFRMKCHLCGGWMDIHTDPKNATYECKEGVRRKIEESDEASMGERTSQATNALRAKQLESNPFFRLEKKQTDFGRVKVAVPKLASIQALSERTWKEDWETSRQVRAHFRESKRAAQLAHDREEGLRAKLATPVKLQKERPEDAIMARNVVVGRRAQVGSESLAQAMRRIQSGSIFEKSSTRGRGAKLCVSVTDNGSVKETENADECKDEGEEKVSSVRGILGLKGKN